MKKRVISNSNIPLAKESFENTKRPHLKRKKEKDIETLETPKRYRKKIKISPEAGPLYSRRNDGAFVQYGCFIFSTYCISPPHLLFSSCILANLFLSFNNILCRLICPSCKRAEFLNMLGFVNHCRILHKVKFATWADAITHCGIPVDEEMIPPDHPARSVRPIGFSFSRLSAVQSSPLNVQIEKKVK